MTILCSYPSHRQLDQQQAQHEKRVLWVLLLTFSVMFIEIIAGRWYGSMALEADGWHMMTHAGAMLITVFAYRFARRHADNQRFVFGTAKIGELAGFANALLLLFIAILIAWESLQRLYNPVSISFNQAILVAVFGLAINLISALLLKGHDHHHHHHDEDDHHHEHDHHHSHDHDNNLKAAYFHVLADALTSVLAIVALVAGRHYGWQWADPLMGVVGAFVITRWSWGLLKSTSAVLLDANAKTVELQDQIIDTLHRHAAADTFRITDIHVWRLAAQQFGAVLTVHTTTPNSPESIKTLLNDIDELTHITVEIQQSA